MWAITVPLSASPNDTTSVCDWTNTSYAIYNLSYNGTNGTAGANGLNFINAYKVQDQALSAPTFTTPTSGATIPSGWTGTAPSVAVGQVLWYLQGQYNSSSSTIDGVAANTTAWTGPIAASIFQDIRSDNWNGSNPPSAGTVTSWGTAGYYIARGDGNMYANGFYARGKVQINGNNNDALSSAVRVNWYADANIGIVSAGNQSSGIGLNGTTNSFSGIGVWGYAGTSSRAGVLAENSGSGVALEVAGKMVTNNNTLVSNLNADYLDNLHASAFVQVSGSTTNGKYLYYVNNTTSPSNPTTMAAWIKVSTNDGSTVWFPGYV